MTFLRRVRSALFIDFDNVAVAGFDQKVAGLVNWLEDGAFSPHGRGRRFLDKRIYWNPQFDRYRDAFRAAGFQTFACRAEAKLKANESSADLVITMDVMEAALNKRALDEIIILSCDTDFVPLVNRLQGKGLRVVAAGRETDPSLAIYRTHADEVIHRTALIDACDYVRPKRAWWRLRVPAPEIAAPHEKGTPSGEASEGRTEPANNLITLPAPRGPVAAEEISRARLAKAARQIVNVASMTPNQFTSRAKIIKALSGFHDFEMNPNRKTRPWLGCGSYRDMMLAMARLEPSLKVIATSNGGLQVCYETPHSRHG